MWNEINVGMQKFLRLLYWVRTNPVNSTNQSQINKIYLHLLKEKYDNELLTYDGYTIIQWLMPVKCQAEFKHKIALKSNQSNSRSPQI